MIVSRHGLYGNIIRIVHRFDENGSEVWNKKSVSLFHLSSTVFTDTFILSIRRKGGVIRQRCFDRLSPTNRLCSMAGGGHIH